MAKYSGRWELVKAESDDVDRAVDHTIAPMSFFVRPIARMRLKKRSVAFPAFEITVNDGGVRVRHEKGMDVTYEAAGQAVKARAPDGMDVSALLVVDPVLTLLYDADEGHREDRYVVSHDGTKLTLHVQIDSPKLPRELEYNLVYLKSKPKTP